MVWAVSFIVNLSLILLLIPQYGIVGAAMTFSIALSLVGFWTFSVYARALSVFWKRSGAGGDVPK